MSKSVEDRLKEAGVTLPAPSAAAGNYLPAVEHNGVLTISGQISRDDAGTPLVGRLGETMDVAQGQIAARSCAIQIIAAARNALGDLERVAKIIKLQGFVNATPQFTDHPAVINGASDFMVEIFGSDIGAHARAAIGMGSLPLGVAVEIDAVLAIR